MNRPEKPDLEERLRELPRQTSPPPELEERVVAELRERGLLAPSTARATAPPATRLPTRRQAHLLAGRLAAAVGLVGLLAGWWAHALVARTPAPFASADRGGERFLLLLSEPNGLATSRPTAALVAEYAAWAHQLESEGRLVAAERLLDGGRSLPRSTSEALAKDDASAVTGFFVVEAAGWDEALKLAASCPHLAYGGRITVRQAAGAAPAG